MDKKNPKNMNPEEEPKDSSQEATEESHSEEKDWETVAAEYLDGWKRTQADFENHKKRENDAKKALGGFLIEKLVLDLIPVLDNFRAATMHVPADQRASPWVVGIQYIEKQMEDVLKENGMETIEAKEGDAFDPSIHEAIESEGQKETEGKETITKVHQKGYRLGDRVIRPAKVAVK